MSDRDVSDRNLSDRDRSDPPPVTVTRPGEHARRPDLLQDPPRSRMPLWVKLAAALAVVGLVAAANVAAAERQRRRDRAAADRVTATVLLSAGRIGLGYVELSLTVTNDGPTLGLKPPRLDAAAGYAVGLVDPLPAVLRQEETQVITLRLTAPCRAGHAWPEVPASARLVVPVRPPSGRVHDLVAAVETSTLQSLAEQACGYQPPEQAAHPVVSEVGREPFAVTFRLTVQNRSPQPFRVVGLTGQGLALSAVGGLPVAVGPEHGVTLQVRLSVPSCAQLRGPLETQRIDTLPFGAFELELTDLAGRESSLPYLTARDTPLYAAIRSLARQICPRATL